MEAAWTCARGTFRAIPYATPIQVRWVSNHTAHTAHAAPYRPAFLSARASRSKLKYGEVQQRSPSLSSSGSQGSAKPGRYPRSLLKLLPWLPVAAFIYNTTFSLGTVNGGSMVPTLNTEWSEAGIRAPRDWVLLNRLKAISGSWEVGDVVVMVSPSDPNILYTKRILALSGDVVRYPYTRRIQTSPTSYRIVKGHKRVRIPPGHCWVEGDSSIYARGHGNSIDNDGPPSTTSRATGKTREQRHTDRSTDSRQFGPIPLALLTAKVSLIIYPPRRMGKVPPRPGQGPIILSPRMNEPAKEKDEGKGWWPFPSWGWGESGAGDGDGDGQVDKEWKRVDDDSRLTPYADEEKYAGAVSTIKQRARTRFVDSAPGSASTDLRSQERIRDDKDDPQGGQDDQLQTGVPVKVTLFPGRTGSEEEEGGDSTRRTVYVHDEEEEEEEEEYVSTPLAPRAKASVPLDLRQSSPPLDRDHNDPDLSSSWTGTDQRRTLLRNKDKNPPMSSQETK